MALWPATGAGVAAIVAWPTFWGQKYLWSHIRISRDSSWILASFPPVGQAKDFKIEVHIEGLSHTTLNNNNWTKNILGQFC